MNGHLNIIFFPHSVNFGLAGTNRLQNVAYYLKKEGNVSIKNIALEDKSKLFNKDGEELFVKEYIELYYGPTIWNFIIHIFKTLFFLYKFKEKKSKNVIYFYGYIDIKNFFFVKWAQLIGYKIIVDIVEDRETVTKFKSFFNKLKYKSSVYFLKKLNLFADGVIVISTHIENKIRNYFPTIPLFFLPVTINSNLFISKKENEGTKNITIFYSGSFNEKDGLAHLLEALSVIKNNGNRFTFVLSGKGSPQEMDLFQSIVTKLDLSDEVDYRGFLSRKDYMDILTNEADILCMTRINSPFANAGFPFKLGEFLATGKPVIASKVGDIEKYLNRDQAFFVEPGNSNEITNALENIIKDRETANQIGKKGKRAAMTHFDHARYSKSLKIFIEKNQVTDN